MSGRWAGLYWLLIVVLFPNAVGHAGNINEGALKFAVALYLHAAVVFYFLLRGVEFRKD